MTIEELEFIKVLKKEGCPYKIEGDKIVVVGGNISGFIFDSLETIPPGVVFMNKGYVSLSSLETLPPGVEFNNGGDVYLDSLKTLPPGVVFRNKGNEGDVYLKSLIGGVSNDVNKTSSLRVTTSDRFSQWKGNIKGIDPKSLLNGMIKRGVFL